VLRLYCSVPQRRAYRIKSWEDSEDFLAQLARLSGKLLKGGDPDLNTAARMVLYDWQRGKIPFYTLPPDYTDLPPAAAAAAAAAGACAAEGAADGSDGEQDAGAAPAAAAAAASGEGMFQEAVTADDAAGEAGARPEDAAAAAEALRSAAALALRRQRRGAIPIKEGYFLPDDEQEEGGDAAAAESDDLGSEDIISEDGDSDDEDDSSNEQGEDSAAGTDDGSEDDAGNASDAPASSSGDDEQAAAVQQPQQPGRKRRRQGEAAAAAAAAAADSGDESDGYGDAGLSWEAVLQAVQVRGDCVRGLRLTGAASDLCRGVMWAVFGAMCVVRCARSCVMWLTLWSWRLCGVLWSWEHLARMAIVSFGV
jgi:nuclear GTP-binding protein